jgi:hypothetical protein
MKNTKPVITIIKIKILTSWMANIFLKHIYYICWIFNTFTTFKSATILQHLYSKSTYFLTIFAK